MGPDPFLEMIQATVEVLERAEIPYAITGSIASGIHGEPVTSQDVDFVVRMTESQARRIDEELPRRFYRSTERLLKVAREGGIANLIDCDTGLKVDLSVLSPGPFHDAVLSRRILTSFGADVASFYTVTPEDVILMKLVWRKESRSTKQWDNALGVARVKGATLDWKYLFEQASTLDIHNDLTMLRDEAGI